METTANRNQALFRDLNPDDEDQETTNIESVCVNCFENGQTRLLLTKIPFYKEVILMSFHCEHCGFENNEIQSASEILRKGCKIILNVKNKIDLNRKVVKSDFTSVEVPEVNLEIPAKSQRGEVTTVEGVIQRTISGLSQDQEVRRKEHPDTAKAIDDYINKLKDILTLNSGNFTLILEDASGNSFIENPNAPHQDENCKIVEFVRSEEQDKMVGIYSNNINSNDLNNANESECGESSEPVVNGLKNKDEVNKMLKPIPEGSWPLEELQGEVLQFQTVCFECGSPCETNMKMTSIPHFKEVVIMATNCEKCGCRTNEVKSGSGIEEKGVRFEVLIKSKEDLTRDVLKSETCSMNILELDCHVGSSALGGRFTTAEGILRAMKDQLLENGSMFHDSADEKTRENFKKFIDKIDAIIDLKLEATLVLDDPAGNSYIQSLNDDKPDDKLKIINYERSYDQNEELGLNDMKTENY